MLLEAIREGLRFLTWSQDSFAYAETFDEAAQRYRGLRCGEMVNVSEEYLSGLLVRPEVARKQHEAEKARASGTAAEAAASITTAAVPVGGASESASSSEASRPRRFHGIVSLDPARVGRDAGRIADEVISHLVGLVGLDSESHARDRGGNSNGSP